MSNETPAPTVAGRLDQPVRRRIVCVRCGRPEDEHCEFEPAMPPGCLCPHGEWGNYVTDVCDGFEGPGPRCERCEHDPECHRTPNAEVTGRGPKERA